MFDSLESLERAPPDTLCGRVGGYEGGILSLNVLKFAHEGVVFEVGDFRFGFIIIETVVAVDLQAEFITSRADVRRRLSSLFRHVSIIAN